MSNKLSELMAGMIAIGGVGEPLRYYIKKEQSHKKRNWKLKRHKRRIERASRKGKRLAVRGWNHATQMHWNVKVRRT